MNKYILIFSLSCILFSLTSCNHDDPNKKVTNEEWNEAIENIVNYKKKNKLNYIAEGDLITNNLDDNEGENNHLKKVECNDNIYIEYGSDDSGEEENRNYSLKDGQFSFVISQDLNKGVEEFTHCSVAQDFGSDFFNEILDIYDNKDCFDFKNNRYVVKDDQSLYPEGKFHVELEFNAKKIKELSLDYAIYVDGTEQTLIKGTLDFTYGNCTASTSSFPSTINWEEEKASLMFTLEDSNYSFDKAYIGGGTVARIKAGENIGSKKKLRSNGGNPFHVDEYREMIVYKNDILLQRAEDASSEGDYYLTRDSGSGNDYKELILKETLNQNDFVEVYFNSFISSQSAHFEFVD